MDILYYKEHKNNFGDKLNETLWELLIPGLKNVVSADSLMGIGTIIGSSFPEYRKINVFSSGVGYDEVRRLPKNYDFWCVRGPLTANQLGLSDESVITDGAILCKGLVEPAEVGEAVSVIPHWQTIGGDDWRILCQNAGMQFINPMDEVSSVIRRIASSRLILTESLHGAIIADTYGIPWISFSTNASYSIFKWVDWTKSVGVDFSVTLVPPPSHHILTKVGRPKIGEWGDTISDFDEFLRREISDRLKGETTSSTYISKTLELVKETAKNSIKNNKYAESLYLNYFRLSPERTSESLLSLANNAQPKLSLQTVKNSLDDRMRSKLKLFANKYIGC